MLYFLVSDQSTIAACGSVITSGHPNGRLVGPTPRRATTTLQSFRACLVAILSDLPEHFTSLRVA